MKVVSNPPEPRLLGEHFEVIAQPEHVAVGLAFVPSLRHVVQDFVQIGERPRSEPILAHGPDILPRRRRTYAPQSTA
jgi:hypothetical protein